MSRRVRVRFAVFPLAAAVIAACFALRFHAQAQSARRQLSHCYQHAFAELTAQLSGMDAALQKSRYASYPALRAALCAEVYSRASAAQAALGELPFSNVKLEQTAAFLARVGDYAWALAKAGDVTQNSRETLSALADISADLSRRVYAVQESLNAREFSPEALSWAEETLAAEETGGYLPAGNLFQSVEEEFPELPTLIYDGPFSDHLLDRTPKLLDGLEAVDADTARRRAAAFLDEPADKLTLTGTREGGLPIYAFSADRTEGSVYLEVTRQGGTVLSLLTDRHPGPVQLSAETARSIARDFLLEQGYADMAQTYEIQEENALILHFAYQEGGILCYPDLIKVTVALDTGEIVGFEGEGYVMNHEKRNLSAPSVTEENARASLSPGLTVLSQQLALIPTAGEGEVLCNEFTCQGEDGRHVLVYFNAQTGREEKILILLEDENGTLVR